MNMMIIVIVAILILMNSFAQIFLKIGAIKTNGSSLRTRIDAYTIIGYLLFFLATLLSVYLLKFINFKSLTVIISFNYVATLILSNVILKEKYTKQKIIATLVIILGVIVFNL
ncbi:EamA family transporter [Candidatus Pristimantibacillus sp. PTI5]|uniref:EamA family transporter n=1 Tax=Candidatus Pristimantibacillus sp. PTI5 TaxID=3400422 RepID=UPI003B0134AA